ncbi:MAG: TonB-dependent receptor [Pseudomonadota bacterium]
MQKTISFKKKIIVSAIASALAGVSVSALAQDDAVEEIVVSGIRASLTASMDLKRDASGVVDAISAEDIGKMPDTNLAESLQRITGVSIDRANGEGFQVTARGFGPQFNLITLNNRVMPATQLAATGGLINNRAFDMSNIASEGVSGVEVYKTSRASVASGGIGATINLKTLRPLDTPGLKFSVGLKALTDTTNRKGDDVTPELSGFGSWTDADEMFGASLSFSHQERNSAQSGVYANNWSDYSSAWFVPTSTSLSTDPLWLPNTQVRHQPRIVNEPAVGQQTNTAPGIRYIHGDYERTRDNAQLTLQFRPIESLTATLDYTMAEQETFVNRAEASYWFGGGSFPISDIQFHEGPVATTKYLWMEERTGNERDLGLTQNQGNVQNNLESFGFNLEWKASDVLTLSLDAHDSTSESLPADGAMSNWFNIGLGARGNSSQGFVTEGDLPLLVGVYQDTNVGDVAGELDIGDVGSTVRQINHDTSVTDITQIQLNGRFEFNDKGALDFGIASTSMENVSKSSFSQAEMEGGWGVSTPGDVPADMMEELNWSKLFSGYTTKLSPEARAFFDASGKTITYPLVPATGTTPEVPAYTVLAQGTRAEVLTKGFIAKDAAKLGELLSANAGLPWEPNPDNGTDRTISEDVTAVFAQLDLHADLGDMPLDILTGVRYERTDVSSDARIATSRIEWQGDNDFASLAGSAADAPLIHAESSYHHVLPSLDLALHITDDVISRVSIGKSIARTDLNNLQKGIGAVGAPRGGPTLLGGLPGTSSDGDTGLKPIESENFDVSLEWYYDDSSYVSIGYFNKEVPNFIGREQIDTAAPGVGDPTNGPRAEAAEARLIALGEEVTQQNLFMMVASMSSVADGGCVNTSSANLCGAAYGSAAYEGAGGYESGVNIYAVANDPDIMNVVATPVNSRDARLYGWELAVQHFFGETGFGTSANYTIVDGSVSFNTLANPSETQFALTGLSDSANLALIYEKDALSARVVYNWRDKFLDTTAINGNEPQFTEDYTQVDFTVGYKFNDNFSLSLEGINILEEDKRQHGRSSNQLLRLEILGARYALSGRYTF